jgi:ferredoxin-NADP reductase
MSMHQTRLKRREAIADGTVAFHFDKPVGFAFKPGQAIDVVLGETPAGDAQGSRHTFSLVSAPFEDELVVATRMRDSAFKRALGSLSAGSAVRLEGPFGSLVLHGNRARPAVLIAGGIGITPFMSMLRQAANDRLRQRLLLLYSNRRPEEAAFLGELQQLEHRNKDFRLVATMTGMDHQGTRWDGATGHVDEDLLRRSVGDLASPIYYLAGPPALLEAVRQTLGRAGVDDDDVRSEEFYGY